MWPAIGGGAGKPQLPTTRQQISAYPPTLIGYIHIAAGDMKLYRGLIRPGFPAILDQLDVDEHVMNRQVEWQ